MEWLNYQHFLYFWVAAKHGSIGGAAKELRLAHPTISQQIRRLEAVLGLRLFDRKGQRLHLTDDGRMALGYADTIFGNGQEFMDTVHARLSLRPTRLEVGVSNAVPATIVRRILEPAISLRPCVQIACHEANDVDGFLGDLHLRALDLVLADAPVPPSNAGIVNHLVGGCGTAFFATRGLATKLQRGFPESLDGAPVVLPGPNAALRRTLEEWFEEKNVQPAVAAEAGDASLVEELGRFGAGVVARPDLPDEGVGSRGALSLVGRAPQLRQQFYAISIERNMRHPAVAAICDRARKAISSYKD